MHFLGYKGPRLLPGLPDTWVPVPCVQQHSRRRKSLVRVGVPLKLAWALTIHKAQGITEPHGVIVSFDGPRMIRAVSRMGLAFVAWTRTAMWQRTAFMALPPIEDFLAVRLSKEFGARAIFEAWADQQHDALFAARGIGESDHIRLHQQHLRGVVNTKHQREVTKEELRDAEAMLRIRGVAPVSDSVMSAGTAKRDRTTGAGLWSLVAGFRADKQATAGNRLPRTKGTRGDPRSRHGGSKALSSTDVALSILREHGYPQEIIDRALEIYGPDLQKCVDFCAVPSDPMNATDHAAVTEQTWAAHVIHGLGFDHATTAAALEASRMHYGCFC